MERKKERRKEEINKRKLKIIEKKRMERGKEKKTTESNYDR